MGKIIARHPAAEHSRTLSCLLHVTVAKDSASHSVHRLYNRAVHAVQEGNVVRGEGKPEATAFFIHR